MHAHRFVFSLLLGILLVPTAFGQATRTVSRTVELADDGTAALDTYKGTIDVKTWTRDSARVNVTIKGEREPVENTRIRIESAIDRLDIETDYDELEENQKFLGLFSFGSVDRPSTTYTITVPQSATVRIDTYSATTTVAHLRGDVHFDAYSAPLTGRRIGGPLYADTYSGDIEVRRADSEVTVDTYSGDLRVDSLYGRVQFSTFSGAADLGFAAVEDGSRFDTFSGDVTASLPTNTGAVIETEEDALNSDVPMQIEQISDDRVRATIGEGGPHVRFETFSGTMSVQTR